MSAKVDLTGVRREYESQGMRRKDLDANPVAQFGQWLQQARDLDLLDATAMTLATVDAQGQPSARVVLLKHFDAHTRFLKLGDERVPTYAFKLAGHSATEFIARL